MAIRKRGKGYQIYFYGPTVDGERKMITKTVYGTLDDARMQEKIMKAEIAKQPHLVNTNKANMRLKEFFMYWLDHYAEGRRASKTISLYKTLFTRIDAARGHKKINSIEPRHIMQFYQNLKNCCRLDGKSGGLSPCTIKKYHTLLHLLFASAVKWQILFSNPTEHVEAPVFHYHNKKIILQPDEFNRFLAVLSEDSLKHCLWVHLAIGMGLRKGEILG